MGRMSEPQRERLAPRNGGVMRIVRAHLAIGLLSSSLGAAACGSESGSQDAQTPGADTKVVADSLAQDSQAVAADSQAQPLPQLQVLPGSLHLGTIELASAQTKPLRVCNLGTAALVVTSMQAKELQPGFVLVVDGQFPLNVAVASVPGGCETGKVVQLTVKASLPLDSGVPAGVLTVSSNDPETPELQLLVLAQSP